MDGPPCALLSCAPSCAPRRKGAANLVLHSTTHIEPWAWLCTPQTPPEASPFMLVALVGALSLLKSLWERRLRRSSTFHNSKAPLNTPNHCQLITNTNIVYIKKFVFKWSIHIIQYAAITILTLEIRHWYNCLSPRYIDRVSIAKLSLLGSM